MRFLRWLAPLIATLAVFLLPALEFSAPMASTSQWSVAELGTGLAHAKLSADLRQARQLRQQFGGGSQSSPRLERALALAALIPATCLLAGAAALLSWLWTGWRKPRAALVNALVGLAASAYAIAASWWLTRVARQEVAQAFAKTQANFGSVLGKFDWKGLAAGLTGHLGLDPGVGLYVLFLVFLALLALPSAVGEA